MRSGVDLAEIEDVESVRASELALLCRVAGREVWIPLSQIDDDSEVWEPEQTGTLVIPEWLAKEKGLI
jgi:hypothetical protein